MTHDRETSRPFRLLVAGGGTGGHLFPGIAVAEEILNRNPGNAVLFVNTGRPVDRKALGERGLPFRVIPSKPMKGRGILDRLKALLGIPKSVGSALWILFAFKPDAVLGVGGYAAAPAALAARILRIPVLLHEQNKRAGLTNRLLSKLACEVHVSFENTLIDVTPEKLLVSGNPVRHAIKDCRNPEEREKKRFTLLVLGGSLGARAINETVAELLPKLSEAGIRVVHQTGAGHIETVRPSYEAVSGDHEVAAFFTDMAARYADADLALCRAGATTLAELSAAGLGAIFIPYPFAADNHQVDNARALEEIGAADIILEEDLDTDLLLARLVALSRNRETIESMARAAKTAARPEAAATIADALLARKKQ